MHQFLLIIPQKWAKTTVWLLIFVPDSWKSRLEYAKIEDLTFFKGCNDDLFFLSVAKHLDVTVCHPPLPQLSNPLGFYVGNYHHNKNNRKGSLRNSLDWFLKVSKRKKNTDFCKTCNYVCTRFSSWLLQFIFMLVFFHKHNPTAYES